MAYYCSTMFFLARQPPTPRSRPGPPHSRGFYITHNDAPHSEGLVWTSDQLVAETSTWQHATLTTNFHAPGGIRTHNLSRRAVADLRHRPHGHWERHCFTLSGLNSSGYFYYHLVNIKIITFCTQTAFMCFIGISEPTAIISLCSIKWSVLVTQTLCLLRGTSWIVKFNAG